jgi:hypothetical protein
MAGEAEPASTATTRNVTLGEAEARLACRRVALITPLLREARAECEELSLNNRMQRRTV